MERNFLGEREARASGGQVRPLVTGFCPFPVARSTGLCFSRNGRLNLGLVILRL